MATNLISLQRWGDSARSSMSLEQLEDFSPVELVGKFPFNGTNTPGRKVQIGVWSGATVNEKEILWTISVEDRIYQVLVTYEPPSGDGSTGVGISCIEVLDKKKSVLKVVIGKESITYFGENDWEYANSIVDGAVEITPDIVQHVSPEYLVLIDGNLHGGLVEWYKNTLDPSIPIPRIWPLLVAVGLCCVEVSGTYESGGKWSVSVGFDCNCL